MIHGPILPGHLVRGIRLLLIFSGASKWSPPLWRRTFCRWSSLSRAKPEREWQDVQPLQARSVRRSQPALAAVQMRVLLGLSDAAVERGVKASIRLLQKFAEVSTRPRFFGHAS